MTPPADERDEATLAYHGRLADKASPQASISDTASDCAGADEAEILTRAAPAGYAQRRLGQSLDRPASPR